MSECMTKERPILMRGELVVKSLADEKTQTRRPIKGAPESDGYRAVPIAPPFWCFSPTDDYGTSHDIKCPYGAPGDRLWVRESFAYSVKDPDSARNDEYTEEQYDIVHRASAEGSGEWTNYDENGKQVRITPPWRPSIYMPRWASRLLLEIVSVRVERVQSISEEDARAEGVEPVEYTRKAYPSKLAADVVERSYRAGFEKVWRTIHKSGQFAWDQNPWCWVVGYRRTVPA